MRAMVARLAEAGEGQGAMVSARCFGRPPAVHSIKSIINSQGKTEVWWLRASALRRAPLDPLDARASRGRVHHLVHLARACSRLHRLAELGSGDDEQQQVHCEHTEAEEVVTLHEGGHFPTAWRLAKEHI